MERIESYHSINGLSFSEVEISRKKHGSNELTKRKRKNFLLKYLSAFGDPIIKILLIALGVNIIFLFKHTSWFESAGIALAVLIATLVSTLSEHASESAFTKLQEEAEEIKSRVKRNGKLYLLPATELVVGDVVLLQSGEKVPGDGHIVWGELLVDQSALNGESKETRKVYDSSSTFKVDDLSSRSGLYKGSVIYAGEGAMIIDRVGDNTFYGKLAAEIQQESVESPLKVRLKKLAGTISRLGYTAAVIVAFANLFNNFVIDSGFNIAVMKARLSDMPFILKTVMDSVILSISVLVMSVPEGLPMMITVVLSANMKKMLKDNVLVRKLIGIETAGSLNILFTDKTGTLTKGKLLVTDFISGSNAVYAADTVIKKSVHLYHHVMLNCLYNSDSQIISEANEQKVIGGNSTDRALMEYAFSSTGNLPKAALLSHLPFNSKNKYSMSQILYQDKKIYLIKGAPEIIIAKCRFYLDENGIKKPLQSNSIQSKLNSMGNKAIRMLALAESDLPMDMNASSELILVGVLGIKDEIRHEATAAINEITSAGISTIMITGDNKETAIAIAKDVGLLNTNSDTKTGVYTSEELSSMNDDEIKKNLKTMRVVARAMPTDKSRLVKLAQEMGLVVGMTGDGINDAPALKNADVGFAMGSGTEVAKEASDIVILDNNISSISKAILYGRTIFKSIRKFIVFQLTMNLCAVTLSVICPFLGIDMPLTVMQMLWLNMIIDTIAGIAFSGEAPLKKYMEEPSKKRDEEVMNRYMYGQILVAGIYTTIMCLLFLMLPISKKIFSINNDNNYFMTTFFTLFIFTGVFNAFNARTSRINIISDARTNPLFVIAMLAICGVQILLIFFGGEVFRTERISITHLSLIIVLASTVMPIDIARKLLYKRIGKKRYI